MRLTETHALRLAVALGSCVPLAAGGVGMLLGPHLLGFTGPADLDSHFRYLSGLLFAIGMGFASTIPRIEAHSTRFRCLTALVVTGGIGRLGSLLAIGTPSPVMLAALGMELLVTPGLALWQHRISGLSPATAPPPPP